jgi:hypothetical protein
MQKCRIIEAVLWLNQPFQKSDSHATEQYFREIPRNRDRLLNLELETQKPLRTIE